MARQRRRANEKEKWQERGGAEAGRRPDRRRGRAARGPTRSRPPPRPRRRRGRRGAGCAPGSPPRASTTPLLRTPPHTHDLVGASFPFTRLGLAGAPTSAAAPQHALARRAPRARAVPPAGRATPLRRAGLAQGTWSLPHPGEPVMGSRCDCTGARWPMAVVPSCSPQQARSLALRTRRSGHGGRSGTCDAVAVAAGKDLRIDKAILVRLNGVQIAR